jgi:hypothetical protein
LNKIAADLDFASELGKKIGPIFVEVVLSLLGFEAFVTARVVEIAENVLDAFVSVKKLKSLLPVRVLRHVDLPDEWARILSSDEVDFLDSTKDFYGDIPDDEALKELDIAKKGVSKTISEGEYVEQIDLPNDHSWKRKKEDGTWCRFSEPSDKKCLDTGDQSKSEEAPVVDEASAKAALQGTGIALDPSGFPVSWRAFDPNYHGAFLVRLVKFRGDSNVDVPDGLRGGEGQLFLSDLHPDRALKRHFPGRRGVHRGVNNLKEAYEVINKNPLLQQYFRIVQIYEEGPDLDWIERDFERDSWPLSMVEDDAVVRDIRARASEALGEAVIFRGERRLKTMHERFREGRDNFHYLPLEGRFLWIDGQ